MKDTNLCIQAVYTQGPTPGRFTVQLLGPGEGEGLGSSREAASWTRSLREADGRPLADAVEPGGSGRPCVKPWKGNAVKEFRFWQKHPSEENSGHSRTNKLREFVTRGPAPRDAPKGVPRGGAKRSPESLLLGSGRIRMGPGAVTA